MPAPEAITPTAPPTRSPSDPPATQTGDVGHWLPRAVFAGMLALILVLLLGTGGYFVYRQEQTFEASAIELEARARAEQEAILLGDVTRVTDALQRQRATFNTALRARLKARVGHAANIAASIHASLNGTQPAAALQRIVAQSLRPIRGTGGGGNLFILDRQNRALLFPLAPERELDTPLALTDDTGHRFIDSFHQAARDSRGDYVRFRWYPPDEDESMADATAYVGHFEPFGWTIGSSAFLHVARAELKRSAVAELVNHTPDDTRFVLIINADGRVLTALPEAHLGPGAVPDSAPWWVQKLLDKGRTGGGVVNFETQFPGLPSLSRHIAYAAPVDVWGWTVAAVARLDTVDQLIAGERDRMRATTREDFVVTLLTMLAAFGIALILSVLFYRWMDERFRRYHQDIETRNRALNDNARELRLSAKVFEASNEAIAILDHRFRIISVNPALERVSGFKHARIVGRHCAELLIGDARAGSIWQQTEAQLRDVPQWAGEMDLKHADGSTYPGWVSVGAVTNESGRHAHFVVSISDISNQKRNEQRLRQLAEYDALTGLPNRVLLLDRMSAAIETARRHTQFLAVLFIDLDRFKNINDSLGHAAGDSLLRNVAHRLASMVRSCDTVSRLGGDEFVVLLTELDTAGRAAAVASKLLKSLAAPYDIDGHELTVTPSIGITVFPDDGDNRDLLLKNADAAMYHAKENGRNSYQFFTRELNERAQLRLSLENDMRRALSRHEFSLFYQPQFDLHSGTLVGAEALLRWEHPERGFIPPDSFIPIAEETGLIVPLGAWILRQACATAQAWRDEGLPEIVMAVNISALQIRRGHLEATIFRTLGETGFPPTLLELELTESALMTHQTHVSATLKAIQSAGVGLAIDDFGTGYSSLAYLKRFKLDKLKIDRSFINELPDDTDDAHLTRAIIGIGHYLDMKVIAEGVETSAQEGFLCELGCDMAQGYLYAKPLPADAFRQMLIDIKYQPTSKPAASTA